MRTVITFEHRVLELWYFKWVFLVTRPLRGYHNFLPCDLDLWNFTHFLKTSTLLITIEQWVLELWYFTWAFLVTRPFRWYHHFWPCDLDLGAWSTLLLIDIVYYFLKISIRAFILHMGIFCDEIFLLVSSYLSLWPWPSLELAIIGVICVSQTHLVIY